MERTMMLLVAEKMEASRAQLPAVEIPYIVVEQLMNIANAANDLVLALEEKGHSPTDARRELKRLLDTYYSR